MHRDFECYSRDALHPSFLLEKRWFMYDGNHFLGRMHRETSMLGNDAGLLVLLKAVKKKKNIAQVATHELYFYSTYYLG